MTETCKLYILDLKDHVNFISIQGVRIFIPVTANIEFLFSSMDLYLHLTFTRWMKSRVDNPSRQFCLSLGTAGPLLKNEGTQSWLTPLSHLTVLYLQGSTPLHRPSSALALKGPFHRGPDVCKAC